MINLGLILFASLFVLSGFNHIKSHAAMAGYTASVFGACPLAGVFGYLGGWPTGVLLIGLGAGAAIAQTSVYFYGIAAFLLVATALFHRNFLKDPGGFKGVSLAGLALAFAALVK